MRLRTLLIIVGGFLGLVCLGAATALVVITTALARSTESVSEAVESVRAAEELEIGLLKHGEAMRSLARPGGEGPSTEAPLIPATLREISESLNRIEQHVTNPREGELADEVKVRTLEHLAALERTPTPGRTDITAPTMAQAVNAAQRLAEFNVEQSRAASQRADRLKRVATGVTLGTAAALVCGLVFAILLVRLLYRRLLLLREAVIGFRNGRPDVQAPVDGPLELREIGEEFNEMVRALTRSREAQLRFVAGVAHDLKNPLSALQLTAASLVRSPQASDSERLRRSHERILHQVGRLNRMVGDLLDTSRIYGGHLELRCGECDLRQIAGETAELYRPTSEAHEIELEVPGSPVPIRCDPMRIEQVLNNLVSNAIKYSPRGGRVRIVVGTSDGFATASVSDEGIGIPASEQRRIFEPFRRSRSVSEDIPGVGLGLAVARTIVEAHEGHIEVESTPGLGSTFRVYLPLSSAAEAGAEAGGGAHPDSVH